MAARDSEVPFYIIAGMKRGGQLIFVLLLAVMGLASLLAFCFLQAGGACGRASRGAARAAAFRSRVPREAGPAGSRADGAAKSLGPGRLQKARAPAASGARRKMTKGLLRTSRDGQRKRPASGRSVKFREGGAAVALFEKNEPPAYLADAHVSA